MSNKTEVCKRVSHSQRNVSLSQSQNFQAKNNGFQKRNPSDPSWPVLEI